MALRLGHPTILSVPLVQDNLAIGALTLRRTEVRPFSQKQIALLQTFADQAVIAINNVRLFEEVQARTEELSESLQQQTATADVLKAISRSAFDLQPVLETLVELATRLCDADHAWLFRREGEFFYWVAGFGHETEVHARLREYFRPLAVPVDRGSVTGRAALEARVVQITDVLADFGLRVERGSSDRRLPGGARRPTFAKRGGSRRHLRRKNKASAICREADRASHHLRRPGGDRD